MFGRRVVVYVGALLLVLSLLSCTQDKQMQQQVSDLQAQVADLQATLADINLRMEEMNSSMFVLRETARNNREAIRKLQQEAQTPTIVIEQPEDSYPPEIPPGNSGFAPIPQRAQAPQQTGGQAAVQPGPPGEAGPRFQAAMNQLSQNNWGLAIYDLNAFVAQYPNSEFTPRAHYGLGEAYRNLSEYGQAVREYERCLGAGQIAGPYAPKSLYWISICLDKLGNTEKAKLTRERLLRDYPDSPEAKKLRLETSG